MGGVADTIGNTVARVGTDISTGGIAEAVNYGTGGSLYGDDNKGGFLKPFGKSGWFGSTADGGGQPGPANPPGIGPTLAQADPAGIPLLAQVALGTDPDEALSNALGLPAGTNLNDYIASQDSGFKAQLIGIKNSLGAISNDINTRTKMVTDLTDNYPQVMAQQLQTASQTLGPQLDSVDAQVLNHAADQLSAKFASTGGFSSGAFNQALSQTGVDLAVNRQNILMDQAEKGYNARYNEVSALQEFQNKMLGGSVDKIFNANQNALDRVASLSQSNNDNSARASEANRQRTYGLFGSIGSLAGTAIGAYAGGPAGAAVGGQIGSKLFRQPQSVNAYGNNDASAGMGA